MPDETKLVQQPDRAIEPIKVTMVGTGDGGGAPIPNGMVVKTPDHQPNIIVKVVTPLAAIIIRFANSYITALVGLVTVGVTTNALPASDFAHLVAKCAGLALSGPAIGFLKDLITILGNLEKKYPLLTGNV